MQQNRENTKNTLFLLQMLTSFGKNDFIILKAK